MNIPQLCKSTKKIWRKVHVEEKSGKAFNAFSKNGSVCGKGRNCRPRIRPSNSCNHIHIVGIIDNCIRSIVTINRPFDRNITARLFCIWLPKAGLPASHFASTVSFRPRVKRNASSNFHRICFMRILIMKYPFQVSFRALDYDPANARETRLYSWRKVFVVATWIYSSTTVAEVPETTTMAPPRKRVTGDKNKSKLDEFWAVFTWSWNDASTYCKVKWCIWRFCQELFS